MQAFEQVQGWLREPHHRSFDEHWESGKGLPHVPGIQQTFLPTPLKPVAAAAEVGMPLHEVNQWRASVADDKQVSQLLVGRVCVSASSVSASYPQNLGHFHASKTLLGYSCLCCMLRRLALPIANKEDGTFWCGCDSGRRAGHVIAADLGLSSVAGQQLRCIVIQRRLSDRVAASNGRGAAGRAPAEQEAV